MSLTWRTYQGIFPVSLSRLENPALLEKARNSQLKSAAIINFPASWMSTAEQIFCGTPPSGAPVFSRGSKCNTKENTVLEGSAGRKIISDKNEAKQFKNGKQLATVSCGKYYMYGTCPENSNGRRFERPLHISLFNSSQKAWRCTTRRQINPADGSIAACKAAKTIQRS